MMNAEHSSPANTLMKGHSSFMPFFPLLVHCKERLGLDIPNVLPSDNTNGTDLPLFLGRFLLSLIYNNCPWSYTFCINQAMIYSTWKLEGIKHVYYKSSPSCRISLKSLGQNKAPSMK